MGLSERQPEHPTGADRRRPRRAVNMRGHITRDGGIRHVIEVVDLNYGGCGIHTPIPLETGESVKLSVLGRGSIAAVVRWSEDGKAGLVFEPIPEDTRKQIERRASRVEVPGEISLRAVGRNPYRVRVLDLSTDGCRVDLVERPNVGEHVLVKFEGIETMDAEICWIEDYTAGLRFEKRIHPAVLDLLLERLGAG